jgi:hypothetical protein
MSRPPEYTPEQAEAFRLWHDQQLALRRTVKHAEFALWQARKALAIHGTQADMADRLGLKIKTAKNLVCTQAKQKQREAVRASRNVEHYAHAQPR